MDQKFPAKFIAVRGIVTVGESADRMDSDKSDDRSNESELMKSVVMEGSRFAVFVSVVFQEEASHVVPNRRQKAEHKDWQVHMCREGQKIVRSMY